MDQTTKQPQGNFIAFLNRNKKPGDKRPIFTDGRISQPGVDEEFPFVLWSFTYTDKATGEILTGYQGEIGAISPDTSASDQIEALLASRPDSGTIEQAGLKLAPKSIVAFVHKSKEGASPNDKTHYGFANFGDGSPVTQLSIWLDKDRYGRAMVSGNTQYPLSKEAVAHGQPDLVDLVDQGVASKGMPKKAAGRSGR